MSRPSATSYVSAGTPYSASHSTAEHTRKASTAESVDSFANPVFFHTPPSAGGAGSGGATAAMTSSSGPSPASEAHLYNPPSATGDLPPHGRPPRASPPPPTRSTLNTTDSRDGTTTRTPTREGASDAYAPMGASSAEGRLDYTAHSAAPGQRSSTGTAAAAPSASVLSEEAEAAAFDDLEREARQALESIAIRDDDVEVHMNDYIETLRQYRDACEARTLYREAHLVEQVLKNLKLEEETRHVRGLSEQQMMERQQLEETHREEFRAFHRAWNAKIDEFEESQLEAEIALLERQNDDLLALHEEMRAYNPRALKCDKHTMDARTRQQVLANQRDYRGASKAKAEGDALEWHQLERGEEERAATYVRRERTLRQHHLQELNALRMKVESKRLLLEKHRKRELDELLQRYINLRRGMDNQHAIVRGKTGTLLLKHAQNPRSNLSGTAAVVESAFSGAFGTTVQRRQQEEFAQSGGASTASSRHDGRNVTNNSTTTTTTGTGGSTRVKDVPGYHSSQNGLGDGVAVTNSAVQADQRRLMDGTRYP